MDDQMHPELENVLQCLSLNGYSVFSLIDDILARGCKQEDQRIKLLREGTKRDAAVICSRLLVHNPASVSAWALGVAQSTLLSRAKEKTRNEHDGPHSIISITDHPLSSPASSSETAWASADCPERVLNPRRPQFNCRHTLSVTIDMLPDNVFLEIFNFCIHDLSMYPIRRRHERTKKWQRLVHVCQRWRRIVFASPRRLDLHLSCSYRVPVSLSQNLDSWPAPLPLAVDYPFDDFGLSPGDEENIVAALKHPLRVDRIVIFGAGSLFLKKVAALMQRSFPALTHLDLEWAPDDSLQALPFSTVTPGEFLGGFSPCLQHLRLKYLSIPDLPTFLWSARTNLVTLKIEEISENGYISPEAMVRGLNTLDRLTTLSITICEDTPLPKQWPRHPDPPMRTTLLALTDFHYSGRCEYLEDFLVRINTPRLDHLRIEYLMVPMQQDEIQAPQLSQFIDITENLKLDKFRSAKAIFNRYDASFELSSSQGEHLSLKFLDLGGFDMQAPCMAHVLGQLVAMFSNVDHLSAHGYLEEPIEMYFTEWLPFFRFFPAVKALHLSGEVAVYIASALEDTPEEMVADVFPTLHLIWLDEDDIEDRSEGHEAVGSMERFLSLRQLSGRPVTIVHTEDRFNRRRASEEKVL